MNREEARSIYFKAKEKTDPVAQILKDAMRILGYEMLITLIPIKLAKELDLGKLNRLGMESYQKYMNELFPEKEADHG